MCYNMSSSVSIGICVRDETKSSDTKGLGNESCHSEWAIPLLSSSGKDVFKRKPALTEKVRIRLHAQVITVFLLVPLVYGDCN